MKVYEKIRAGIWVYNGVFRLVDAWQAEASERKVWKFRLELIDEAPEVAPDSKVEREHARLIPSHVKLEVWRRDAGQCAKCGCAENLHFDHILPYSRGGTSLLEENIRWLCQTCNLKKSAENRVSFKTMSVVRCRLKLNLWWLVIVCVPAGAFFFYAPFQIAQEPPHPSLWPMLVLFGPMALFFWGGAIYLALALLREEILADEDGLRWRGAFSGWKCARWDEISDFYLSGKLTRLSPVQTAPLYTRPTVVTPHGQLKLDRSLTCIGEMMPLIAARALNAPSRNWEIFELRASQGFSQRFSYWTPMQKWMAPIQALGAAYLLIYFGWMLCFGEPATSGRYQLSRPVDWFSFGMAVATLGPIAVVGAVSMPVLWRHHRFAFRHRHESLEITLQGLSWSDGQSEVRAAWDEVRAIRFAPGTRETARFQVETRNGDFPVWRALESITLWVQQVNYFAPHFSVEIPTADPDLGGESQTWSGGKIGEGARIFHFRTRDTRLVLWAATVFGLVLPLLPLLMHAMKTPDDEPSDVPWKWLLSTLILIVLALIYVWWCFSRAAIWADETGLEWRVPLRETRRASWNQIQNYGRDERGFFLVVSGEKRRFFGISTPARQDELLQLIAERATAATGHFD